MKEKIIHLRQWAAATLVDYPEIAKTKNATEFYNDLFEHWSEDIQLAMKSLAEEIRK